MARKRKFRGAPAPASKKIKTSQDLILYTAPEELGRCDEIWYASHDGFISQEPGDLARLAAGPDNDRHVIVVHEDLLTQTSEFAAARFSERWSSGRDSVMDLSDTHPLLVETFVTWIYSGYSGLEDGVEDSNYDYPCRDSCIYLIDLYALGEFLESVDFKDDLMQYIKEYDSLYYDPTQYVSRVYRSTRPGSKLRDLLVDYTICNEWLETHGNIEEPDLKLEFLTDVVERLTECDLIKKSRMWAEGSRPYLLKEETQ